MATSQQFLVCDSSTLANFKAWASAISAFFTTAGWTQSSDTGQVNWSTISTVPGSAAYVYEIWQPNDGFTTFYVKMEYGNLSGTNSPSIRITISTSTNGSGTATGSIIGPTNTAVNAITPPSTSTTYECDFSGALGRMGAMMWRNAPNSAAQLFAIERSLNSSGSYTGTYVTLWTAGTCSNNTTGQRSLVLGVGASTSLPNASSNVGGWAVRVPLVTSTTSNSASFNGSIPFDTAAPLVGYFDFPCTVVGMGCYGDFSEGVTFTVTLYGSTRTYMASKVTNFNLPPNAGNFNGGTNACIGMRYD